MINSSKKSFFKNKNILKILDYYKNLWALSHASAVLHWDLETYMPVKGAVARGEALAKISSIRQKMFLDPGFAKLLASLDGAKNLNDYEQGVVRVLSRSLKFYKKIPPQFIEDFEKLINRSTLVWRKAKETGDFKLFEPYLFKIFNMKKKEADYLGYTKSPYDALLDQFEEDLTVEKVGPFFEQIRQPLLDLKNKITKSPKYFKTHALEKTIYNKQKMQILNNKVLNFLWGEYGKNFRLDISSHPFTTSFGNNDTRITTWYHRKDFARSLLATIHEFGHALYDLQSADGLEITPIAGGSSLVIHESQSRFWENFVGRSPGFVHQFIDDIRQVTGDKMLKEEEVYTYFNKVSPGYLRVEADEVTYHFHIMLRFEIEQGVIEGKIKTKDIKEIWNLKMQSYLGLKPKDDTQGVLQDIHWSGGMVGYFPTYSLGTFLAAQWEGEISNKQIIESANYEGIKIWLREHVHQYGSTYVLKGILKKNKMEFDPAINLEYLKNKYSKIYGFL